MKPENIAEAICAIDEDIIASAEEKRAEADIIPQKGEFMQKKIWIGFAAMAACAVLAVGAWQIGFREVNNGITTENDPPAEEKGSVTDIKPPDGTEPFETEPPVSNSEKNEDNKLMEGYENLPEEFGKIKVDALAHYPETAAYPNGDDDNFMEQVGKWCDDREVRYSCAELVNDSRAFCNATAKEFLTDSDGENRVYSPLSVYCCLAMLAETADGKSRAQVLELLGEESIESLRENIYNLWQANYCNDGASTCILANSMWLNEDIAFRQSTLDTLARDYFASSFSGDMASENMTLALRAWLNFQTGGLLEDSVEGVELEPETFIALCNTVYFRGKWTVQFDEAKNDTKVFHSPNGDIEAEFMNQKSDWSYYWGDDYSAVNLPVGNADMWLILPDEDKTVDDVINSGEYLDMVKAGTRWENRDYITVNYSVPKFDVQCNIDLVENLKKLGITDVFDSEKSDFSSLCDEDGMYVSQAAHSARVVIDEDGCTAAAYTLMTVDGEGAPPPEEVDFILDRPFVFVIDNGYGQVLFTGVVNVPQ